MERLRILARTAAELVSAAFAALSIVFDMVGLATDRFIWQWWTLGALAIFIILVYWRIFQLHRRLMPKLDIVFDTDKYPDCLMLGLDPDPNTGLKAEHRYYRVGVINKGNESIEGVAVKIAALEPKSLPFTNIPLTLMHSRADERGIFPSEFTVNPGMHPSHFVDVANKSTVGSSKDKINLDAAVPDLRISVPSGRYTLTLIAEGRNVPECRKTFIIDVDTTGKLLFQPE